jgi:phosphoribosylformylglycinamidine cyclo-ligase
VDNIPRILPKDCDVIIRKGTWNILPVFQIIEAKGGVPEAELYEVFNMGIGMTAIVSGDHADAVLQYIHTHGQAAWRIGEVVHGKGHARII